MAYSNSDAILLQILTNAGLQGKKNMPLTGLTSLWQKHQLRRRQYFIKSGYVSRLVPEYFRDNIQGINYQPDVYPFAGYLARQLGCRSIIDIGCGNGKKLAALYPEFQIVGLDFGPNLDDCKKSYPFGRWIKANLEKGSVSAIDAKTLQESVIICSDVIEHLTHPENLLFLIKHWMKYAAAGVLSTPERDLVRGSTHMGPPDNQAHIREWNLKEFEKLLNKTGFEKSLVGLTLNNDQNREKKTILGVLLPSKSIPAEKKPSDFKVVALITAYNEEDMIEHTIRHLAKQGVLAYVIDNWSTDGTYTIIQSLKNQGLVIGSERFPAQGPAETYCWHDLLSRVESLAHEMEADWFIHHDSDEIRLSPWENLTVKEAIHYVDALGFNAIDYTVINFKPTENGFSPGADPETFFKYFEFGKRPGHFLQIKGWKKPPKKVSLAYSGGHEVVFEGRRVFPLKFLMKHYPVRSQQHGEKKILSERKPRWNTKEKNEWGWHNQYDNYEAGCSFLSKPEDLIPYNGSDFTRAFFVERLSGLGISRE